MEYRKYNIFDSKYQIFKEMSIGEYQWIDEFGTKRAAYKFAEKYSGTDPDIIVVEVLKVYRSAHNSPPRQPTEEQNAVLEVATLNNQRLTKELNEMKEKMRAISKNYVPQTLGNQGMS